MPSGYLRYPDIHQDLVVLVADDDLWLAPVTGGRASRLTTDHAPVRGPRFSPDGTRIAWTSTLAQRPEVFVLDLADGSRRRLTWLGAAKTAVVGWADDEHVVISSPYQRNDAGLGWLYTVGMDGEIEPCGYGPGMDLAVSAQGAVAVVTPNSGDCSRWKRYRGGTAGQIWLRPAGAEGFRRLLRDGNDDHGGIYAAAGRYSVGWIDGRLIFSSDMGAELGPVPGEPGNPGRQAQLWSVDAEGADLRLHTRHGLAEGYVRDPRTDGSTIVYHARGRLYAMAGLDAEPAEIPIELGLGAPEPIWVEPTDRLERIAADHGGDGSLLEWRGAAYYLTHRSGPARALSGADGVRIREPRVLGRTGRGIWASDAAGQDCLEIAALDGTGEPARIAQGLLGRVLALEPDPKGERAAVVSHDGRVLLVDIATGAVREIARSRYGEATGLSWSPDGRYLAWRSPVAADPEMKAQLRALDTSLDGAEPFALTRGSYDDSEPVFSADGRYLVFLSARTFDPDYDGQTFDLTFGHTIRPWLVPLRAEEPSPFGPSPEGWRISEVQDAGRDGHEAGGNDGKEAGDAPEEEIRCQIDADGFEERMVAFPVASGAYHGLSAVKDGVSWIQDADRGGQIGTTRAGVSDEPPADALWTYNLTTRRAEEICEAVDSYSVSGDGERLVVRHRDDVTVIPADHKVETDDPARVSVDLSRLRRRVDPRAEWRQMFEENGRLMASHYWRADMNGTDWQGVLASYRPALDRLAVADDLYDVLWETVAELNTSHSYVSPVGLDGDPAQRAGRLGADLSASADGGATVRRVVPGESSDPRAWSPLRAAGVAVRDGDVITAVDGRRVRAGEPVDALLEGSAGRTVELTVRPAGGGAERRVAVVPMGDESVLRYHDWVASRRRYVEEHSGGRLGYLHVPDMVADGWAELYRQIAEATHHEGVIADVRFNRGGHTSQLVVEKLARRVVGWDFARYCEEPATYPQNAVRGPIVLVTNQWAGSDGDIVSAATQAMGYATVIGERSWGGVIGIDGRFDLVDGTGVTQPRYAGWYGSYGWGVENHGVDPDIVVTQSPEDWESDRDVQLDAAIAECLRRLAEHPAAVPPEFPPPAFG